MTRTADAPLNIYDSPPAAAYPGRGLPSVDEILLELLRLAAGEGDQQLVVLDRPDLSLAVDGQRDRVADGDLRLVALLDGRLIGRRRRSLLLLRQPELLLDGVEAVVAVGAR